MSAADAQLHCPSTRCSEDAILLGVIGPDGRVAYVNQRLQIDADFVTRAKRGRVPEQRFRFASTCIEGGCGQWTGTGCGVIESVLEVVPEDEQAPIPRCSIRPDCRWFAQEGTRACQVCPLVVTDER